MKKLSLLATLLILGMGTANAQESFKIPLNLKTNLLSLASIYGELELSKNTSIQGGLAYDFLGITDHSFKFDLFNTEVQSNVQSIGVPIEARFYVLGNKHPLRGFYVGPYLKYKYVSYLAESNSSGWFGSGVYSRNYLENSVALGFTTGYQTFFSEHIVFNLMLGAGVKTWASYTLTDKETGVTTPAPGVSALSGRMGIMFGYRVPTN